MKKQFTLTLTALMMVSSASFAAGPFIKAGERRETRREGVATPSASATGGSAKAVEKANQYEAMATAIRGFTPKSAQGSVNSNHLESFAKMGEIHLIRTGDKGETIPTKTVSSQSVLEEAVKIVRNDGGNYSQIQIEAAKNALVLLSTKEFDLNDKNALMALKLVDATITASKEMKSEDAVSNKETDVVAADVTELSNTLANLIASPEKDAGEATKSLDPKKQKEIKDCE